MSMTPEPHHHEETTPVRDPEGVAIVVAILVFLAVYLIPALTD